MTTTQSFDPRILIVVYDLAVLMGVPVPMTKETQDEVMSILARREVLEAVADGIISKREGSAVVVAEIQEWLLHRVGKSVFDDDSTLDDFEPSIATIERTLFEEEAAK